MPTRADMEAAIPRCPRHVVARSQLGPGQLCYEVLSRETAKDDVGRPVYTDWRCPRHGRIHGSEVAPKTTMGVAA